MVINIPNPRVYHLIYCLQNYIVIGFVPPMLGNVIKLDDFEHMWRIKDLKFREYLAYNIIRGQLSSMKITIVKSWK
jgi:hypothetical protein